MAQFPDACRFSGGKLTCCGRASPPSGDFVELQNGRRASCFCYFYSFLGKICIIQTSEGWVEQRGKRGGGVQWFRFVTSRDASKQTDVSGRNTCRTLSGACNNVWGSLSLTLGELYDSGFLEKVPAAGAEGGRFPGTDKRPPQPTLPPRPLAHH